MSVAGTILQQLGGNRFQVMTGARSFVSDHASLTFRVPRASNGITHVNIRLNASDTYTITFGKVRDNNYVEIAKIDMVYIDRLRQVFTERTGLRCSL